MDINLQSVHVFSWKTRSKTRRVAYGIAGPGPYPVLRGWLLWTSLRRPDRRDLVPGLGGVTAGDAGNRMNDC